MRVSLPVTALSTACVLALAGVTPASAVARTPAVSAESAPVKPDTQVSFFFGLKRDDAGAEAALKQVSYPSSPQYRQFPSRQEIAQKYGASPAEVSQVAAVFDKYGLTSKLDPAGVFLTVTGTADQWENAFQTPIKQQKIPLEHVGQAWQRVPDAPKGPASDELERLFKEKVITEPVLADVAYSYDTLQLSAALPSGFETGPAARVLNKGTPQACPQAAPPYQAAPLYAFNQLRTAYGVDGMPTDVGSSVRMTVMSVGEGFADGSLRTSGDCFSLPEVTFSRVTMPQLDGPLPEGGEGDMDVQIVQGVLPAGSQVTVLEYGSVQNTFLHWSALFGLPEQQDVVTSSRGECEQQRSESAAPLQLEDSELLRVALSGTSVFNSSGDSGSSGCYNFDAQQGPKEPAVTYPASSPYVTAVGGTFLEVNQDNTRSQETVWNNTQNPQQQPPYAGGTGGYSSLFARPWWQPQDETHSAHRAVPDLAVLAAWSTPGWPLAQGQSLSANGGTSAASPFTAAGFAVIAAQERAAGRPPLGLVQPWLYQLRQQDPKAFYDVVTKSNDLFGVGCCDAHPGYDAASGLGAPNFAEIAAHVPPAGSGSPSASASPGGTP